MSSSRDLYETLEVSRDATSVEIKKAYRKLALAHHPDKVSEELREESEIKFKEISHAYEVLIDEERRANYDTYGTEDGRPSFGDSNGFASGEAEFGPEDFFNFFNGGGRSRQPPRQRRTLDAKISVEVTLEDLYKGKVIKTTSTRNIICKSCKGSGMKTNGKQEKCVMCNGEGQKAKLRRLSPGVVTQEYVTCTNCEGTGKVFKKKDRCKKCAGKKVREETKILEFNIEKGSKSTGKVILKGESDEEPGKETGDVILSYTTKPHDEFERRGNDLYVKLTIKLFEALCGFSRPNLIRTLDNRLLSLKIPPGKVLRPGDLIKIPNEGMPIVNQKKSWFGNGDLRGDLYIDLTIEFPQDNWFLEKNEYNTIKSILSNVQYPTKTTPEKEQNGVDYETYDIEKFVVVEETKLPHYEEEIEEDEYPPQDDYNDGYYENVGVEPECQQQ